MIFVTVGTTYFDELITEVDRLVGCGEICDEVIAQIGQGNYQPSNITWFRYLDNIDSYFKRARRVIGHGGTGTVFRLLQLKKDFIAVANRQLQDDHQSDLLRAMESHGWCVACYDLGDLAGLLRKRKILKPYPDKPTLPNEIWTYLAEGVER